MRQINSIITSGIAALLFHTGCGVDQDDMDTSEVSSELAADCSAHPVITVTAYNGQVGSAICRYGYTRVYPYGGNQYHDFIIGTNNSVYHDSYSLDTHSGTGWQNLGGTVVSGVAAGVHDGKLQICARGTNSDWYRKEYTPGSGWGNWIRVGPNAQPACVWQDLPQEYQ
jgi:hypothetical protein